jgi:hypothetical protein
MYKLSKIRKTDTPAMDYATSESAAVLAGVVL